MISILFWTPKLLKNMETWAGLGRLNCGAYTPKRQFILQILNALINNTCLNVQRTNERALEEAF